MRLHVLTANHSDFTASEIDVIATHIEVFSDTLKINGAILGYITLSTCNRFEIYLECEQAVAQRLAATFSQAAPHPITLLSGPQAARHLYEVAAGLDSLVVGEREIVGQLRRALAAARAAGTTTKLLETVSRGALATARRVCAETDLAAGGRSIAATALELARTPASEIHWPSANVLLVGTGSYAGATLAAMRRLGVKNVEVWSASGRAEAFARRHGIAAASALDLVSPRVMITCRGTGQPVITATALAEAMPGRGPLTIIDLARSHDVEPASAEIAGVRLITLDTIRAAVPTLTKEQVTAAKRVVADGLDDLRAELEGRAMDPLITAIRTTISELAAAEPGANAAPAAHFASVLAHRYASAARRAARAGRAAEFHAVAELVFGAPLPRPRALTDALDTASENRQPSFVGTNSAPASAALPTPADKLNHTERSPQ
ncbi:hypothetical protein P8A24_00350 [Arcanobacterium wilhelmae]|uniref:hypothetical protein n=1 Tax=Arcanobacterium wilhelmae TaxID=1803177 RepID=UPI0024154FA0|nr:hypothetical protein [Arcanobacterium wilhelmae]WFN90346.1 hypothetical protein P8A24_00350 [Arcanobacterium wilhelmae]